MVANDRRATIDDLDALPDDGRVYELLNGEITVAAAPTWRHGLTVLAISDVLRAWVRPRRLGVVQVAPIDVVLDGENVVHPDVIFVRQGDLANATSGRYLGAPSLAVEVISPTSRSRDSVEKPMHYARAGAGEYWLVDPQLESAALFTLLETIYVERAANDHGTISSVVLPGLTLNHVALFARVNERMRRSSSPPGDE